MKLHVTPWQHLIMGIRKKLRRPYLPHELFPEVLDWEIGDQINLTQIKEYDRTVAYLGSTESGIFVQHDTLGLLNLMDRYLSFENKSLCRRRDKNRTDKITKELRESEYSNLLKTDKNSVRFKTAKIILLSKPKRSQYAKTNKNIGAGEI